MIAKPYPVVAIMDEDSDDRLLLKEAFEQCRQDIDVHPFGTGEDLLDYLTRAAGTIRAALPTCSSWVCTCLWRALLRL